MSHAHFAQGLHNADLDVRVSTLRCIAKRQGTPKATIDPLEEILSAPRLGKDVLVDEVLMCLSDANACCRAEALYCISRIGAVGHVVCVSKAIKHLQDNDLKVRLAAVETLSRISSRRDFTVISALIAHLQGTVKKDPTRPGDPRNGPSGKYVDPGRMPTCPSDATFKGGAALRIAAVRALGVLADEQDLRVVACIADVVENEKDDSVRAAAVNVLVSMGKSSLAADVEGLVRGRKEIEYGKKLKANGLHTVDDGMKVAFPLCARDRAMREILLRR